MVRSVIILMMDSKKVLNFKAVIFGLIYFSICSLPYIHINFEKVSEWKPYKEHYAKYNEILEKSNLERNSLLNDLSSKKISIEKYVVLSKSLDEQRLKSLKAYHIKKNHIKKEFSFFGYSSFRYFLYALGLPLFALFVSIFSTFLVFKYVDISFYKYACYGFVYVSSFWFLRSFLTRTDFPKFSYDLSYVICSIFSTIIIVRVINLLNSNSVRKKEIQKELNLLVTNGNKLVSILKS